MKTIKLYEEFKFDNTEAFEQTKRIEKTLNDKLTEPVAFMKWSRNDSEEDRAIMTIPSVNVTAKTNKGESATRLLDITTVAITYQDPAKSGNRDKVAVFHMYPDSENNKIVIAASLNLDEYHLYLTRETVAQVTMTIRECASHLDVSDASVERAISKLELEFTDSAGEPIKLDRFHIRIEE